LGADVSDKLKLKSNVIYNHFNRRTLLENGNASVLLNAVNAPSVLSPMMLMVMLLFFQEEL
jgi:hypothetical protein